VRCDQCRCSTFIIHITCDHAKLCDECYGGKNMDQREIALKIAWSFLGKPYIWGGDDPMRGFDCSGFTIECLKSVGRLPRKGDWTAQGLFNLFRKDYCKEITTGCLVFWGSSIKKIIHVEFCIDDKLSIGASGGGSRTKTAADAISQNAYIKIRPFRSRNGIAAFCDPFL